MSEEKRRLLLWQKDNNAFGRGTKKINQPSKQN